MVNSFATHKRCYYEISESKSIYFDQKLNDHMYRSWLRMDINAVTGNPRFLENNPNQSSFISYHMFPQQTSFRCLVQGWSNSSVLASYILWQERVETTSMENDNT